MPSLITIPIQEKEKLNKFGENFFICLTESLLNDMFQNRVRMNMEKRGKVVLSFAMKPEQSNKVSHIEDGNIV